MEVKRIPGDLVLQRRIHDFAKGVADTESIVPPPTLKWGFGAVASAEADAGIF